MMIRSVIVDDEKNAIKSLEWEIKSFCPEVEICDTFSDPHEAISGINYIKPDCVFLDIDMPEMDGFQLLQQLRFRDFELIFTTAYDTFAYQAYKEKAIDYLLKPIDSDDLKITIGRVAQMKSENRLGDKLKQNFKDIENDYSFDKIPLSLLGKTLFVERQEIVFCKAEGNYTHVYLTDGSRHLISKKIRVLEEMINSNQFFRTHHSFLVKLQYIKVYLKIDGHQLVLFNGENIPVSRQKREELLSKLGT